jgi:hypothetical protein
MLEKLNQNLEFTVKNHKLQTDEKDELTDVYIRIFLALGYILHNCSTTFPNVSKPSARFK